MTVSQNIAENNRGVATASADAIPGAELRVVSLTTVEAVRGAMDDWRGLLRGDRFTPASVEPTRYLHTLEALRSDTTPHVICLREGERTIAMVIGRLERARLPCRIGYLRVRTPRLRSLRTVYGGVLTDGREETARRVAEALTSMLRRGEIEHVWTNKLSLEDPVHGLLKAAGGVSREVRPHWVTDLTPGSFAESMRHHSSKHMSNLRRLDRKLCAHFDGDVELRVATTSDEVGRFVESMRVIFERTYKAGIAAGQMEALDWDRALEDASHEGWLRGYLLVARGEPIAYQTGTLLRGVYHAEGTGFLPEHGALRPGTVLMVRVLQDLCEQGAHLVDWGFGDAEYKRLYGTRHWDEAALNLYGATPRALLTRAIDRGVAASSAIGKRLGGSTLVSRIRRGWRQRAQARRS